MEVKLQLRRQKTERGMVFYADHTLIGSIELELPSESQGKAGATSGNSVVPCKYGKENL